MGECSRFSPAGSTMRGLPDNNADCAEGTIYISGFVLIFILGRRGRSGVVVLECIVLRRV